MKIFVPQYLASEFRERQNKYCICVFVINEGEKLLHQLEKMESICEGIVDIVVADGGSTDGSTEHEKLKELGVNTLLVKHDTGKLGSQMRMAFDWALKRGYEGVIVVDGNGKDGMEAIPRFVDELKEGVDHVQGSRFIKGGYHENTPKSRLLGLKLLHVPLMRLASGFKYTDTTNGFRAYSAKLLSSDKLAIFRDCFSGYELHYYLAIEAARQGFSCSEIPVSRVYPATGKVPTKISGLKGNFNVILKLSLSCLHLQTPRREFIRYGKTSMVFLLTIIFACLAYYSFCCNSFSAVGKAWFERWEKGSEDVVIRAKINPATRVEKWYSFHYMEPHYPGIQGIACSYICHPVEDWPLDRKIEMLHKIWVVLAVLALTYICFWMGTEFSLIAAILFAVCTILCQFTVISARNLYWCIWTMYLPLALFLYVLRRDERVSGCGIIPSYLISVVLTLYLRFTSGFEYSSCMMVLAQLPLIYYAIKNKWSSKRYFLNAMFTGILSIATFFLAYLSYFVNVLICKTGGDFSAALDFVMANVRKRTGVGKNVLLDIYLLSFLPDLKSIFSWHLNYPVTSNEYGGFKVSGILAAAGASFFAGICILFFAAKKTSCIARKYIALGIFSFLSIMLPFIWIITAKGHAFYHPHINFILWNIPVVFMAGLMGYTVSLLLFSLFHCRKDNLCSRLKMTFFSTILTICIILGFLGLGFLAYASNYSGFRIMMTRFKNSGKSVNGTDIQYVILPQCRRIFFKLPNGMARRYTFFCHIYPVYKSALAAGRERFTFNSEDFYLSKKTFKASINENLDLAKITDKSFIAKPAFPRSRYEIVQWELPSYPYRRIRIGQYNPARNKKIIWTLELTPSFGRRIYKVHKLSDQNWEFGVFRTNRKRLLFTGQCSIFKGDIVTFPNKSVDQVKRVELHGGFVHVFLEKDSPSFNPDQPLLFQAKSAAAEVKRNKN